MKRKQRMITVSRSGFEAMLNALAWAACPFDGVDENGRCRLCDTPRGFTPGYRDEAYPCENKDCHTHDFEAQMKWAMDMLKENERRHKRAKRRKVKVSQ